MYTDTHIRVICLSMTHTHTLYTFIYVYRIHMSRTHTYIYSYIYTYVYVCIHIRTMCFMFACTGIVTLYPKEKAWADLPIVGGAYQARALPRRRKAI